MLAMAVIIIPLGVATIIMAIELGLFFEALSGMLILLQNRKWDSSISRRTN